MNGPNVSQPSTTGSPRGNALALAALGIVFGDIGTSPLYTLSTCFQFSGATPSSSNLLGICSLLVWVLIVVVCFKYVGFIMRADDDGEGGILALLAMTGKNRTGYAPIAAGALTTIVIAGAAMLLGDGMITPAISVISAIEGLNVITPGAQAFVVPLSVVILLALFSFQSKGTDAVGKLFGPVMLVWFGAIAVAGVSGILERPEILWALDPRHAVDFVFHHGAGGFLVLGGIVLAVTGVEALYADLSHFGRAPITRAWYAIVLPSLMLCYLGQGARMIADPKTLSQSFFALSPGWTLYPMIAIATLATIIASQALISGAFTLAEQAVALGLWPRMFIRHTSSLLRGQVYVPAVNRTLAIGFVAPQTATATAIDTPTGLAAAKFSEPALAALTAAHTPAFVYFTADWCLTCKVNERGAIASADVAAAFRRAGVRTLVGDWTNGDPVLGQFIEAHNRAGVPLYLFYHADGRVEELPQILTVDRLVALAK